MHIVTIAGSLRERSHNAALLRAAAELAPDEISVDHADLHGVPLFDEDREGEDAAAPALVRLRDQVRGADALLIATPEYNQAMPGVLKNVLDQLSRAAPDRVLDGMPVAVVGATTGPWGTRYAQQMTRHVLAATGALVMSSPALFVAHADQVIADGVLHDAGVRAQVSAVVTSLVGWAQLVGADRRAVPVG